MIAIAIRDLWVTYNSHPVLEDVNLNIEENTCVGILGPNGAGKSTLLKVILGLIPPNGGKSWSLAPPPARPGGRVISSAISPSGLWATPVSR